MALNKIESFKNPVSSLADNPKMSATDLKAWFDSNSNEIRTSFNELIDVLQSVRGAAEIGVHVEGIDSTVEATLVSFVSQIDEAIARANEAYEYAKQAVGGDFIEKSKIVNDYVTGGTDTVASGETIKQLNDRLSEVENVSTVNVTLAASSWSGSTYIATVNGVTSTSNQFIIPALDITSEQFEALQGASILDAGQSENTIILKAFGEIPTIDLPIRVIID